jgi:hypothetical protein
MNPTALWWFWGIEPSPMGEMPQVLAISCYTLMFAKYNATKFRQADLCLSFLMSYHQLLEHD